MLCVSGVTATVTARHSSCKAHLVHKHRYIWGTGRHGQLGNLKYKDRPLPSLVDRLQVWCRVVGGETVTMDTIQLIWHLLSVMQGVETQLTAVGFQHTVAVMADGRTMAWGHTARGRLGVGTLERKGVPPPNNHNFPIPTVVPAFAQRKVKQVPIAAEGAKRSCSSSSDTHLEVLCGAVVVCWCRLRAQRSTTLPLLTMACTPGGVAMVGALVTATSKIVSFPRESSSLTMKLCCRCAGCLAHDGDIGQF